jgi:separase
VLRAHSVSRVPSLYYLGLQLAKYDRRAPESILRDGVDAARFSYILDPEDNLPRTKARFAGVFAGKSGWQGLAGTAPTGEQFQAAMADYHCFLYLGHGTGDRYLSRAAVRMVPRCGVVMLIGCSSGKLKTVGDLDPAGAPLNFLLAGSPCVVSNLWDVTDKDIDRLSQSLISHWTEQEPSSFTTSATCLTSRHVLLARSLCDVLPRARRACKLPFLTAAATVCHGLPVYIRAAPLPLPDPVNLLLTP